MNVIVRSANVLTQGTAVERAVCDNQTKIFFFGVSDFALRLRYL
jgi:hypothetical protein